MDIETGFHSLLQMFQTLKVREIDLICLTKISIH